MDEAGVPHPLEDDDAPLSMPASLPDMISQTCFGGEVNEVRIFEDWLPVEVEAQLLRRLKARQARDFVQLRGKRTARYGGSVGPPFAPEPLPPWLAQLCGLVGAATAAAAPLNHVLVNSYQPGEGIMPHRDGGAYEPRAAILSLGSAVVFDFWRDHAHAASAELPALSVLLPPRSLLLFEGSAYERYMHSIDDHFFDSLAHVANCTADNLSRWMAEKAPSAWAQRQFERCDGESIESSCQTVPPMRTMSLRRDERYSLTIRRVPLPQPPTPPDAPVAATAVPKVPEGAHTRLACTGGQDLDQ